MDLIIFSWWGLYDYVLVTGEGGVYKKVLKESLDTLIGLLSQFRGSYWSVYDLEGRMASPFYHNLHIAQMQAMYELTGESILMSMPNVGNGSKRIQFAKDLHL